MSIPIRLLGGRFKLFFMFTPWIYLGDDVVMSHVETWDAPSERVANEGKEESPGW